MVYAKIKEELFKKRTLSLKPFKLKGFLKGVLKFFVLYSIIAFVLSTMPAAPLPALIITTILMFVKV